MGAADLERRVRRLALENALEHGGQALPGPIVSRLLGADPALRSRSADVGRLAARVAAEVSRASPSDIQAELEGLGGPEPLPSPSAALAPGELSALPGAVEGQVVLRLAPFPSGGLHIGHARMLFVNDYYRRRYRGKLLLVFDDTVGSEEKRIFAEAYDLIARDLEFVDVVPDATFYKSDRIPTHYEWARKVIDRGAAYVCVCPAELLRENRASGTACPERTQSADETVAGWDRMLAGGYAPGEAILRLRTDMRDPDPAFRDRVLFRISDLDHPRVGRKFRVWPMLEFSWAVDDVELGVSHVLRGKDLVIEDRMERYLWTVLGLTGPVFVHWGMLRVREAKVSKSKAYREVMSGEYDSWADPRTWSLASLDRRGITREALHKFIMEFGVSLADIEVPAETLYAENRAVIDPTTPRRAFVPDPILVRVDEYPEDLARVTLANHPDRPELGMREVAAGPTFWLPGKDVRSRLGEEIRLKDLVNVQLPERLSQDPPNPLHARFTTRENKRLPRLQWVGAEGAVRVEVLEMEGTRRAGWGESALRAAAPRQTIQFERFGFVKTEADWTPSTEPVRVAFGHP